MTTLVKIFEFSLLYVNTLALNPQWMVTCIAQQFCSRDKCLKGLSVFPFQPSQAGGHTLALKFFSEIYSLKKILRKPVCLKEWNYSPSLTTLVTQWRGEFAYASHTHRWLIGWLSAGRTQGSLRANLVLETCSIWVRSWLKHFREAVWKSSHEKHAKNPVLMQTTWLRLHLAI